MAPLLPRRSALPRLLVQAARRRPAAGGGGGGGGQRPGGWRAAAALLAGGLAPSAALGCLLVTSQVVGGVSGAGAVLAALLASLVALVTGLYLSELTERRPDPPACLYSAAYASAGELAAFLSAWLLLVLRSAALAAAARAISTTVDQLTGGHLAALIQGVLGGGNSVKADPLAAGICLMLAALLALGLESAAWLRGLVLLTTTAASGVFAVSAAFFTEDSSWGRQPFLPRGLLGLLEACAVYSVAMWRGPASAVRLVRSRGHCWDGPRLTAAACGILFLAYCCLATSAALVQHYHGASGPELWALPGLGELGLHGAELAVGCFAVAALSLLLVELAAPQGALVTALATDGLLPPVLTAPAPAAVLPTAASAAAAGLLSTLQLLRLSASCQLLLAAVLLCRALLERYAASVGVTESTTSTTAAPGAAGSGLTAGATRRRPASRQRSTVPLYRLKAGLSLLPHRLSQSGQGVAVIGGPAQTTDGAPLLPGGGAHPACGCSPPPGRRLILNEDEEDDEDDEDTDVSELESDDTDIDAVVAEFRQHSVQFRPSALPRLLLREEATAGSARRVSLCLAALVVCAVGVAVALVARGDASGPTEPIAPLVTALLLITVAVLVAIISRQPWCSSCHTEFRAPGCPWLPCAALAFIIVSLITLTQHVWPLLIVAMATGLLVYALYGARHSRLRSEVTVVHQRDLLDLQTISSQYVVPAGGDPAPGSFQTIDSALTTYGCDVTP